MARYEFFVPGIPATAGSKKSFAHKNTGKIVTVDSSGDHGKQWRSDIKHFAFDGYQGPALEGPIWLFVQFIRTRPKSHFGTGKNSGVLKDSAPPVPITRPDCSKMLRAVEDALTGTVWRDDSQVQPSPIGVHMKVYGDRAGVRVIVCTTVAEAMTEQIKHLTAESRKHTFADQREGGE